MDYPDRPSAGRSWGELVRAPLLDRVGVQGGQELGLAMAKDPRPDPARISRHWFVLSVATLLTLAYGTRVEDAYERLAPGSLRAPPRALAPTHRSSRENWDGPTNPLLRSAADEREGQPLGQPWLLPEPWPEPKSDLEVTRHAPT